MVLLLFVIHLFYLDFYFHYIIILCVCIFYIYFFAP